MSVMTECLMTGRLMPMGTMAFVKGRNFQQFGHRPWNLFPLVTTDRTIPHHMSAAIQSVSGLPLMYAMTST